MQKKYRDLLILLFILFVAGGLRFGFAGVNQFASDEARVSLLALQMAQGDEFISYGISSSVGARNLPASIYVFLPPFSVSSNPLVATLYVGVLNWLAIGALFWLVKRTWGLFPATTAALYLAAAPLMVSYSRSIWTQNLLMPFTVFWLCAVMTLNAKNVYLRRFSWAAMVFIAGFAVQVHLAGLALCLATLYVIIRFFRRVNWLASIAGGVLALIFLVPFLYQTWCCTPELVGEYLQRVGNGTGVIDTQISQDMLQLALNQNWDFRMAGNLTDTGANPLPPLLAGLILLIGIIGLIRRRFSHDTETSPALEQSRLLIEMAFVLILSTLAAFTYHSTPVHLHYALVGSVGLALIAGGATLLIDTPRWRYISTGLMLILALIWSGQVFHSLNLLSQRVPESGGVGVPLGSLQQVADAIPDDGIPVIHVIGSDTFYDGDPATWNVLFWNRPHILVDGHSALVLPDEPAYLMTIVDGIHAWQEMQRNGVMDEQLLQVNPLPGLPPYHIQAYNGDSVPLDAFILLDEPIPFETGLTLYGWQTWRVAHQIRLSTLYKIDRVPVPGQYHQFTHLRTENTLDTEQPALIGDTSLSAHSWRADDWLIAIAVFEPGDLAEPFWFDIGHYQPGQPYRYQRLDAVGGDSVRPGIDN